MAYQWIMAPLRKGPVDSGRATRRERRIGAQDDIRHPETQPPRDLVVAAELLRRGRYRRREPVACVETRCVRGAVAPSFVLEHHRNEDAAVRTQQEACGVR